MCVCGGGGGSFVSGLKNKSLNKMNVGQTAGD